MNTINWLYNLLEGFQAETNGQQQRKFYGVFIVVSPAEVAQAQHLNYVQSLYDYISRQSKKQNLHLSVELMSLF